MLSIAPMVDWTDTSFRYFMRLLAPNAFVYTEMITTKAIIHQVDKVLFYEELEHPIVLQVGGSEASELAYVTRIAEQKAFDEVNLNLGCPSPKVQSGQFGACLMKNKALVYDGLKAMLDVASIPVTIKVRLGVDELDSLDFFMDFVGTMIQLGIKKVIVHARKAWLKGLCPKQNRTIPPIQYDKVYYLKTIFPETEIIINGDIKCIESISSHLSKVDGVMLGRLACDNPYMIACIHASLYPDIPLKSRYDYLALYLDYAETALSNDVRLSQLLKPIMNLSTQLPNGKQWKHALLNALQSKKWSIVREASDFFADDVIYS